MITSRIIATGACVPELVVTNDDLAGIVDTSDEWVTKRTGISRRHISQGENLSDLAAQAAQQVGDVRAENAAVAVRLVEHHEAQPAQEGCPLPVVAQN